jgi:ribosomal subunit interface protein
MKVTIKATGLTLTPALRTYVEKKIGSFARFVRRWDAEGAVEASVEIGRTTEHHQKGDVFRAEANLRLPKRLIRAEAVCPDLRVAIDRVRDTLHLEIKKYKEKMMQEERSSRMSKKS